MKKIAIITGASSGFGSLFANKIADRFKSIDELYLVARREDRLIELAKTIDKPCKIISMDLKDMNNINKLIDMVAKEGVQIKMLVNSAGFGVYDEVIESRVEDCEDMIDLNCKALTVLTKELLPFMAYNSRIINIASCAAFLPQKKFAIYAATKSYVLSFTRALNVEIKDMGIRCTAVCPGPSETEFFDRALNDNDNVPFYKNMFMSDPEGIVEKAINDSVKCKEVSVYSVSMNAFRCVSKVIPHSIILKIMSLFS